jgi:hypothetical protein
MIVQITVDVDVGYVGKGSSLGLILHECQDALHTVAGAMDQFRGVAHFKLPAERKLTETLSFQMKPILSCAVCGASPNQPCDAGLHG